MYRFNEAIGPIIVTEKLVSTQRKTDSELSGGFQGTKIPRVPACPAGKCCRGCWQQNSLKWEKRVKGRRIWKTL